MRFYVLGTNFELCMAEFFAVYPSAKAIVTSESVLVCDKTGPDPAEAVNRLAGVVKAGTIQDLTHTLSFARRGVAKASYLLLTKEKYDEVSNRIIALLDLSRPGKVEFGLSLYDGGNAPLFGTLKGETNKVGMTVKRALEAEGRKVRVVAMKGDALSSVAVTTQAKAGDIALIATAEGALVGRTQAVQDFEAWSKRDFGRPSRDAKSGMLPPKLARTLVNLATRDLPASLLRKEGAASYPSPCEGEGLGEVVLLDPFCGSGTVPMEAMLMGFKGVIASDISAKATGDTGRNLEWVRREFPEAKKTRVSVYTVDATDIATVVKEPVDAVATETYLGPPMHGRETTETIKKNMADLGQAYAKTFAGVYSVMKPGARAAVAFPAFVHGGKTLHLTLAAILEPIGFVVEKAFLYERKGQKVVREILVLKRP